MQELPGTQVTIGPAIENGFYYDFVRDEPFTPEDLPKIEERMREIVDRDEPITREVWDRSGDPLLREHRRALQGGDHRRHSGGRGGQRLPPGRLARPLPRPAPAVHRQAAEGVQAHQAGGRLLAGRRAQRHAATDLRHRLGAPKQLEAYLTLLEEAEKRDHRRLGREMELFHFQEEAAGSVFWHPKGWTLYRLLQDYMRARLEAAGYVEVRTPQLYDRTLWEKSGHWEKFREHMFTAESEDKCWR